MAEAERRCEWGRAAVTLEVGQTLWYVPNWGRHAQGHEVTVTKVARRWASLGRGWPRIDKNTLWADGGDYGSPGRCYLSEAHYRESEALQALWRDFSRRLSSTPPGGLTEARLREIAAEWAVPIKPKEA